MKSLNYYITYVGRLLFIILIYICFTRLYSQIEYDGWQVLIFKAILFLILYNILFVAVFWKSKVFGMVKNRICIYINKKKE